MNGLPPELIDAILESGYYANGIVDSGMLLSAALVCRAWTESAQRLLFRYVLLRGSLHKNGFVPGYSSFLHATSLPGLRG